MFIFRKTLTKISLFTISALFILTVSASVWGQTVIVNYDFNSAVAGTPCTATPLTTAGTVSSTFTTGGTGTGTCTKPGGTASTVPPAFVANAANPSVSLTSFAAGSTNYFQFQLSGVSSYQNYQLFFQSQRSGTGPVNADVQYSLDGTTFTTFQTFTVPTAFATFNIDLSAVSAIEGQPTVYFRILGRDGTNVAGTFRIDNFQVQAQLSTAANSSISGRVLAGGNGVASARLMLSGGRLAEPVYTTTNSFGYYTFSDVPAGESYIVTVSSKRYSFANPSLVINLNESVADADFVADER